MAKSKGKARMYIVNSDGVNVTKMEFEGGKLIFEENKITLKAFKPVNRIRKIHPPWTIWSSLRMLLQPGTAFSYN